MADKTSNGASGRSDLDPFAELTKIMGFDPRVPVEASKPAAASQSPASADAVAEPLAGEDFSIDLEQELLGAIDGDERVSAEAPSAVEATAASPEHDEPAQEAPDLDLQDIEDEISKHVDAFIEADRVEEPAAEVEFDAVSDDQPEEVVEEALDLDKSLEDAFADADAPQPCSCP